MSDEYLTGKLNVHFMVDAVVLVHKVRGRVSHMDLIQGDHIEIENGEIWEVVSFADILNKTVEAPDDWKRGMSIYQDACSRVKLGKKGNKLVNYREKHYKISMILYMLRHGEITEVEAAEAIKKFEIEDD